ncbi:MAG: ribosome biogenesis GTP-binding protein YihA/YsxC [Melioribacter sp.]|uniref:ribosome biogenesis GTP-binding protein YihA/YsxC n=1 Tax=Rosettibacter primus TaxID=3111523 RepID=UPI00247CA9F4|nr:ribosome biogenesis GTP-binding protein YihA/YsxC [Melioribacter sp.]
MRKIEFIKSIYKLDDLPKRELPTVILCGRSNVGKSSFINSIFSPLKVAKTSSTPGKTRSLNYYLVEDKFYIVDLPGFGYAKVSRKERIEWQKIIESFIELNKNIVLAFHLIDSRYNPMPLDFMLNEYLRSKNIPYYVIFNKIDKLKQSEIALLKKNINKFFPELIFGTNAFLYSSIKNTGKKEIVKLLSMLMLS